MHMYNHIMCWLFSYCHHHNWDKLCFDLCHVSTFCITTKKQVNLKLVKLILNFLSLLQNKSNTTQCLSGKLYVYIMCNVFKYCTCCVQEYKVC